MSTKFATIIFDQSEKWLDKQREIDSYTVDGFKVENIHGKTAKIVFLYWRIPREYENMRMYELPQNVRNAAWVKIIRKNKRITFENGKLIISICGLKYQIGTYTEVLKEQS